MTMYAAVTVECPPYMIEIQLLDTKEFEQDRKSLDAVEGKTHKAHKAHKTHKTHKYYWFDYWWVTYSNALVLEMLPHLKS